MTRISERPEPQPSDPNDVLFASVWLVFLVVPVLAVFNSDAGPVARGAALTGIGLFAVLYVLSWIMRQPLRRWSLLTNTVLWVGVGLISLIPLVLVSPMSLTSTSPFFMALFAFRLPVREGVVGGVIAALLTTAPMLVAGAQGQGRWVVLTMAPALLIITVTRYAMHREEVTRKLREELQLAQQRETVGRDVHDILGHSLTVISVKTQLARRLLTADPERAGAELDEVLALTREALADVRTTVGKLREPELSAQLVQSRSALRSADITAHVPSSAPELDPDHRSAFAWILREAVTNVVRHSGASSCTVSVTSTSLTVVDDGAGCGPREGHVASSSGVMDCNGLRGMRERAHRAGLELTVRSPAPGTTAGTRVRVEVAP